MALLVESEGQSNSKPLNKQGAQLPIDLCLFREQLVFLAETSELRER